MDRLSGRAPIIKKPSFKQLNMTSDNIFYNMATGRCQLRDAKGRPAVSNLIT